MVAAAATAAEVAVTVAVGAHMVAAVTAAVVAITAAVAAAASVSEWAAVAAVAGGVAAVAEAIGAGVAAIESGDFKLAGIIHQKGFISELVHRPSETVELFLYCFILSYLTVFTRRLNELEAAEGGAHSIHCQP